MMNRLKGLFVPVQEIMLKALPCPVKILKSKANFYAVAYTHAKNRTGQDVW